MRVSKFVSKLVSDLGGDYKKIVDKYRKKMQDEGEEISNTRLFTMNCGRGYFFRYYLGITEKNKSSALDVGAAFAKGSEIMYRRKNLPKGIRCAQIMYSRDKDTSMFDSKDWQTHETHLGYMDFGLSAYHREFWEKDKKRGVVASA